MARFSLRRMRTKTPARMAIATIDTTRSHALGTSSNPSAEIVSTTTSTGRMYRSAFVDERDRLDEISADHLLGGELRVQEHQHYDDQGSRSDRRHADDDAAERADEQRRDGSHEPDVHHLRHGCVLGAREDQELGEDCA